jgi:PhzF family phenazine biosynthesis protein
MRGFQINAFVTDKSAFSGNPAGVVLAEKPLAPEWMQAYAAQMNLPETAFAWPEGGVFRLRWFTPVVEVPLCGHATLAAAHALFESGINAQALAFDTASGRLTAVRRGDRIELDFPVDPAKPTSAPMGLAEALGVNAHFVHVGKSDAYGFWLLETKVALDTLRVDQEALSRFPGKGFIVTAPGKGDVDFVSRFFAPALGIPEDPVTGAAHCVLAPHWAQKLGKHEMRALQLSPRGGDLGVVYHDPRVKLSGRALTVLQGVVRVPI